MAKMNTCLALILTLLNLVSLGSIIYLSLMKVENKNNLTYVIIVAIASYFFGLILISSFCITENECCETCCPANKCCLCYENNQKGNKSKNANGKNKECCDKFCDCLNDCCLIPLSSCIRKIGKQGSRYCSLIFLTLAHIGIAVLCFYSIKGTTEKMSGRTIGIVIICAVITLANLFGIIAPCFNCCERLRYKEHIKKESKPKKEDSLIRNNNTKDENIIQVDNNIKEEFLQKV